MWATRTESMVVGRYAQNFTLTRSTFSFTEIYDAMQLPFGDKVLHLIHP